MKCDLCGRDMGDNDEEECFSVYLPFLSVQYTSCCQKCSLLVQEAIDFVVGQIKSGVVSPKILFFKSK